MKRGEAEGAADRRSQIRRKVGDLAALLPVLGAILFASPLIFAFAGDGDSALTIAAGLIFTIWGALILAAYLLSRLLRADADRE